MMSLPAVAIAIVYPFLKRFFVLPQAFLGLAFSFGIPMAYAAVYDAVPPLALVAARAERLLGDGLRHRVRDGRSRRRSPARPADIGDRVRALDVFAVMLCYAIYLGGMAVVGQYWLAGPFYYAGLVVGARVRALAFLADPHTRSRPLLPRLPAQSLARASRCSPASQLDFAVRAKAWPQTL